MLLLREFSKSMTMHLLPPWASTTGKRKGKRKFRSAEAASAARQNSESWRQFCQSLGQEKTSKRTTFTTYKPPALNYRGRDQQAIPSVETTMEPCVKAPNKVYTGTLIRGVATMHKSNAVPVINDQEIIDISKMRR